MIGSANIEARRIFSGRDSGPRTLVIHNPSMVNIYIDSEHSNRGNETGIPLLAGEKIILQKWEGEVWISADVDGTAYNIFVEKLQTINSVWKR